METQLLIGRAIMSTPIVESGQTTREAYFPGEGWFSWQTGKYYEGGSVATITNQLTDEVPLFVRRGWLVMRQDSENVTKTNQLDNAFELVAGC